MQKAALGGFGGLGVLKEKEVRHGSQVRRLGPSSFVTEQPASSLPRVPIYSVPYRVYLVRTTAPRYLDCGKQPSLCTGQYPGCH